MLMSINWQIFWSFCAASRSIFGSWPHNCMPNGLSSGEVAKSRKVEGLFLHMPWLEAISVYARAAPYFLHNSLKGRPDTSSKGARMNGLRSFGNFIARERARKLIKDEFFQQRMQLYKDQRVGVLVDVQNLYYSARYVYKKKVNFAAVLKDAVNGRTLIRALAYVIRADELKEKSFFEALSKIGFDVKAKDLQTFYGGEKKGDWDVGIAVDAIQLAEKLDVVVIVSGDGDYRPLVEYLKNAKGCRVEAIAFGKSTSRLLREVVDEFVDLDNNARKYLL